MKPKITVYVTPEELAQLRKEAARRRISVSRYAKDRLTLLSESFDGNGAELNSAALPLASDGQLAEQIRNALSARADDLADNMRTVMVMLDQLVRSTLTHLPEIPAAQQKERLAAGERRHRDWQGQVEILLRQLRGTPAKEKPIAVAHGTHA